MRSIIISMIPMAVACVQQHPVRLTAQVAVGPADAPPGGVLVFSSRCSDMQAHCPSTWAATVDAIVTSGLEFHGYTTIDPARLRKDDARRSETTRDTSSRDETHRASSSSDVGAVAILPLASYSATTGMTISMHESHEKTVVIDGATLEDLALADRRALMKLAGARSVLTTQIILGASWTTWTATQHQTVEVMIKLSDADHGEMRWSARCTASSGNFPSPAAAIEAAAHCVVDALTAPHA